MADNDDKVIDLTDIRVTREAIESLETVVRESCRMMVESIAAQHGGKPEEWIAEKSEASAGLFLDIVDSCRHDMPVTLPGSLSADQEAAIRQAMVDWIAAQQEYCLNSAKRRVLELLGP